MNNFWSKYESWFTFLCNVSRILRWVGMMDPGNASLWCFTEIFGSFWAACINNNTLTQRLMFADSHFPPLHHHQVELIIINSQIEQHLMAFCSIKSETLFSAGLHRINVREVFQKLRREKVRPKDKPPSDPPPPPPVFPFFEKKKTPFFFFFFFFQKIFFFGKLVTPCHVSPFYIGFTIEFSYLGNKRPPNVVSTWNFDTTAYDSNMPKIWLKMSLQITRKHQSLDSKSLKAFNY